MAKGKKGRLSAFMKKATADDMKSDKSSKKEDFMKRFKRK